MIYDIQARCKFCTRYLKLKVKQSSNFVVTCPDRKCKQDNEIKVVMLSDLAKQHRHPKPEPKKNIVELQKKLDELDGRTKEAKELKEKIADMENYIASLEGIIDGQG